MNTAQLVDVIQDQVGGTKADIRNILYAAMDKIVEAVSAGDEVKIGNHRFKLVVRKPRKGVNPKTREPIEIGERRYVMYRKRI